MQRYRPLIWLSLVYVFLICCIKVAEHAAFESELDVAIWDQAIWALSRGLSPYSTILGMPKLADHFDPLCFMISPFYAFHASVAWLFLFQALFTVAAGIGLYRLALHLELSEGPALWTVALFLFAPGTIYQALYPLHLESLGMALWIWTLYRLLKAADLRFALVACFLCALCKEESPLAFLTLAAYLSVFHPPLRQKACILGAFAVAQMAVLFEIVVPGLRGPGPNLMASHYGSFGTSFGEVALHMVTWPGVLISHLFTWTNGITLLELIGPTAGLCLAYPPAAVIYLPLWAANSVSNAATQHLIFYHHHTLVLPGIYYGLIKASRGQSQRLALASATTLIALLLINPVHGRFATSEEYRAELAGSIALIPPSASVLAPMNAVSHLSERVTVYVYPKPYYPATWPAMRRLCQTDYVILDYPDNEGVLKVFIKEALNDPNLHIVYRRGSVLVLERGGENHAANLAALPADWTSPPDAQARLKAYNGEADEVDEEALLKSLKGSGISLKGWIRLGLLAEKQQDAPAAADAFRRALATPGLPAAVRDDLLQRLRKAEPATKP